MPERARAQKTQSVLSSSTLESQLMEAPHSPEALSRVVGWIWSSLVYTAAPQATAFTTARDAGLGATAPAPSPSPPPYTEDGEQAASERVSIPPSAAATATATATETPATSAAMEWESLALSSVGAAAGPPWRSVLNGSTVPPSGLGEPATPYLEHTLAGRTVGSLAAGLGDSDEAASTLSPGANLDATLTVANNTGHSLFTSVTGSVGTAPSSVAEWPLPGGKSAAAAAVPLVQLSPMVLRLLLWWATQTLLFPTHSTAAAATTTTPAAAAPASSPAGTDSALCSGSRDSPAPAVVSLDTGGSSGSGTADFVTVQQRQQRESQEARQLRLRIAEIFSLLCRRGHGVVVSDALVYGTCHDSSEAAARRCNVVFSACSDAVWQAATSLPTAAASSQCYRNERSSSGPAPLDGHCAADDLRHGGRADTPARYRVDELLSSLFRLHTLQGVGVSAAAPSVVDADVAASGQLLRCFLRCPRLHKRVMRLLLHKPAAATVSRDPVFRNTTSATLLSLPGGSRRTLGTQATDCGYGTNATRFLSLAAFLPALTHTSPVVVAEAWQTLRVLLFPAARMTAATQQLLTQTPECVVQRLLSAALSLSNDGSGNNNSSSSCGAATNAGVTADSAVLQCGSHAVARNSALRLLHVLCVSKEVPPSAQLLFSQCPALLWRVLRLAAEVCHGNPVANAALVRVVLADYVLSASQPTARAVAPARRGGGGATVAATPVQRLLLGNAEALSKFFSATRAAGWGVSSGTAADAVGEDSGGDCAEAATEPMYDEAALQRAVQMLRA